MTENKDAVIKSLRNALVKATDVCIWKGVPTQNKAQFLSLINGAIADANEVIGENAEIENIRKRWAK
jgi:hypothetical protein